ncbi:class I SAM-dependent RNA methyltransferase [Alloscardovia theropitheci]|uniref:Class I SAM-dependent RNA methyltransferase n=1 Tax=Alloscardovia theropitheci TaxID=2496842 RepID=A0A4R0QYG1_9BIFI|nr:TRAM domain-containing protein [Alloscardovia theropitheci]TCD54651.1 class I SAM-dependent RNA methyltransferase [Alloscardovia theropitheci]
MVDNAQISDSFSQLESVGDGRLEADVTIERFADQGRCVAHIDGRVVFVRFALPGEKVRVRIDEPHNRRDRFWTAEVTKVYEESPYRVEPSWLLAGPLAWGGGVGGADLTHVSLEGQLLWKRMSIEEQLKRIGKVEDPSVPVLRVPEDEGAQGLHWRTRVEFIADDLGYVSMRRRESHDRVRVKEMPLASEQVLAVADELGLFTRRFEPGAHIRITAPEPREGQSPVLESGNWAMIVNRELAEGHEYVRERVVLADGKAYEYSVLASGFWQMHRMAPQVLVRDVVKQVQDFAVKNGVLSENGTIWDLYSGSGLFTMPLASRFVPRGQVLAIEGAEQAVSSAMKNAKRNNISNVTEVAGDVLQSLRHVKNNFPELAKPDVVVLDPPRAGAGKKVVEQIVRAKAPVVVYVSCDPASLARDIAVFRENGYALSFIHAHDIYPMTHHVETVAVLTKAC